MKLRKIIYLLFSLLPLFSFGQSIKPKVIALSIFDSISISLKNDIVANPEVKASFPGGVEAWKKYLLKHLSIQSATKKGAPQGLHTVILKFIITNTGNISYLTTETNIGYGMEDQALKLLQKNPIWIPAQDHGENVMCIHTQPISFYISE